MAICAAKHFVSDLIGFFFGSNREASADELPEPQKPLGAISTHKSMYLQRLEAAAQTRPESAINSRESEGLKQLLDFQRHSQGRAFENAKQRASLSNSLQKRAEQDDIEGQGHSNAYDHIGILFGS